MSEENRNYTATFVIDGRQIKESVDATISTITEAIESSASTVNKLENLGNKEFARIKDKKFAAGIFIRMNISGSAESPAKIKSTLRLNKAINRILIQAA
jgi:small subunit ribosomal protein S6